MAGEIICDLLWGDFSSPHCRTINIGRSELLFNSNSSERKYLPAAVFQRFFALKVSPWFISPVVNPL